MSMLFGGVQKASIFNWIKSTVDLFVMNRITPSQRDMLQRHVDKMQAYPGTFEVKCEIAQDIKGESMKLTITIEPEVKI